MASGRDEHDRLLCQRCDRPIGGLTGLDEIHNLMAHFGEHHEPIEMDDALELRAAWERGEKS